ncbi:MAG: hypothetical protein ACRC1K_07560, partial [Planctomycetia bacterium]
WSDASADVYVEPDIQYYIAEQKAKTPDRAEIEVQRWDAKYGEWINTVFVHEPGDIIGTPPSKKTVSIVGFDEEKKLWELKEVDVKKEFDTSTLLLDIEGGTERRVLPSKETQNFNVPKELVSINAFGDLIRRDAEADLNDEKRAAIATAYKDLIEQFKPAAPPPMIGLGVPGVDGPAMADPREGGGVVDPLMKAQQAPQKKAIKAAKKAMREMQ